MTNKEILKWFKIQFGEKIAPAITGTPFDINIVAAISFQETGYIWRSTINKISVDEILAVCVGDTIDKGRTQFPKNKEHLLQNPDGQKMFDVAREALRSISVYIDAYKNEFVKPHKFCRGYGIFQYDLQFFPGDKDFFLQKKWFLFQECLNRFLDELKKAQKRAGYGRKESLTDKEKVFVAIAYNAGSVNTNGDFKQGHQSGGKYYGEYIHEYFTLAKTV